MLSSACPLGLMRLAGTMLPGNGVLFNGSLITRALRKNGLAGSSSSLKLPLRMARLGTVPVLVVS